MSHKKVSRVVRNLEINLEMNNVPRQRAIPLPSSSYRRIRPGT